MSWYRPTTRKKAPIIYVTTFVTAVGFMTRKIQIRIKRRDSAIEVQAVRFREFVRFSTGSKISFGFVVIFLPPIWSRWQGSNL